MNPDISNLSDHPSFLELDRAALGGGSQPVARHLETCARCQAHVARIADPGPLPAELARRLEGASGAGARRSAGRSHEGSRRLWLGGLAAAAAAALVLLALLGRDPPPTQVAAIDVAAAGRDDQVAPPDAEYDTVKGARAVGVYLRRGRRTFLWDGRETVLVGDAVRLKLVSGGLGFAHVFSEVVGQRGAPELVHLHEARLSRGRDALLEAAWQVDGATSREVLVVVMSREHLTVDRARASARDVGHAAAGAGPAATTPGARATDAPADLWVSRVVLPVGHAGDVQP